MTGTEGEIVYWQYDSSGRVHKRVRVGSGLESMEGDNLDSAGSGAIIDAVELSNLDAGALCERCFGKPESA